MGNRSNINLVGNTTQGMNVGGGDACVFKGKAGGNLLQFRTISATGTSIQVIQSGDEILISGATGGGSGTITGAINGLGVTGSDVCLGGTLSTNTTICGSNVNILRLEATDTGYFGGITPYLEFFGDSPITLRIDNNGYEAGIQIEDSSAINGVKFANMHVSNESGLTSVEVSTCLGVIMSDTSGRTYICNLPTKTSETCGVYIDSNGKLSTGVISGGSGTNYWTKTGTDLCPTTAGDDILLPAGDVIKWSDASCICSSGNSLSLRASSGIALCVSTNYMMLNSAYAATGGYLYVGGLATKGIIDTTLGGIVHYTVGSSCNVGLKGGLSSTATAAGNVRICGGQNTSTGAGGDVCIIAGASTSGTAGRICLIDLPTKTTETCGIYIDASGRLSKGVISGGTSSTFGWLSSSATVAGCNTLASGTTTNNTIYGANAGRLLTSGQYNVAVGTSALCTAVSAYCNIAIGSLALEKTTGNGNVGIGYQSLQNNSSGINNTAVGTCTLMRNTTGNYNVAMGYYALVCNCAGSNNIGIGNSAAGCNRTGCDNVAIGASALFWNLIGKCNIAIGYQTLYVSSGSSNIGIGTCALYSNRSSSGNTAIGENVLRANTTGCTNIGIGFWALYANIGGCDNVAIGCYSMGSNTYGCNNIALGCFSLPNNTIGNKNIAIGCNTLRQNTSGCGNIAIGECALQVNTTNNNNVGIGGYSLYNANGISNTAIGSSSLSHVSSGCYNVGVGQSVGNNMTTGCYNVFVGYYAGGASSSITGSRNVKIGCGAGCGDTNSDKLFIANCPTTFLIKGDFAAGTICRAGGGSSWDTFSDVRIKENIDTIPNAINTLSQLNPVLFDYTEDYTKERGWNDIKRICNYGFIAQEFEQVFPKYVTIGCEKIGDCVIEDFRSINDGHLVPLLVKAIQEQQLQINALCQKIIELEK